MQLDNTPLVSLVIPVYNAKKYLPKCLDSIREQTYQHWEAILVDDCSTDGSMDLCHSYAVADCRFKVISTPRNIGAGEARWLGICQTVGSFIGFVDSDDWLSRNFLQFLLQYQQETDADIVSCQALHSEKNGILSVNFPINMRCVYTPKEALIQIDKEDILYPVLWDKLYRREIILSYKIETRTCEDGYALVEYFKKANRIAFTGLPLYYYNKAENQLSCSVSRLDHYKFYCHLAHVLLSDYGYASEQIVRTGIGHMAVVSCLKRHKRIREYLGRCFAEELRLLGDMRMGMRTRLRRWLIIRHMSLYMKVESLVTRCFHKRRYKHRIVVGYTEATIQIKKIVNRINNTKKMARNETFDNYDLFE